MSDNSNYYTLIYSSTKPKFDGNIRTIKITLEGKHYHLGYRRRYYADNPSTLNRPETAASPDIYLPEPSGDIPWKVVRAAYANPEPPDESKEPILRVMRYGAPESTGIAFASHVEPTDGFAKATPAQMDHLQNYESFFSERVQNAMAHLTKKERRSQHKGRTVLDTLPAPDPVFLQPYSIDFSLVGKQLSLTATDKGEQVFHLEVAIIAYDALGKKVNGLKETITGTFSASYLQQFQASDYHAQENIEIPDRVTLLRLAVRDISGGRMGSLEIPVQAISSPYRRKQLNLPATVATDTRATNDELRLDAQ
ncbi:MAG: hypothetical protein LAP86_30475 [Acidobacteriia bacterium]|nr:hypothetical protein [Terriglobia bacterium]